MTRVFSFWHFETLADRDRKECLLKIIVYRFFVNIMKKMSSIIDKPKYNLDGVRFILSPIGLLEVHSSLGMWRKSFSGNYLSI